MFNVKLINYNSPQNFSKKAIIDKYSILETSKDVKKAILNASRSEFGVECVNVFSWELLGYAL